MGGPAELVELAAAELRAGRAVIIPPTRCTGWPPCLRKWTCCSSLSSAPRTRRWPSWWPAPPMPSSYSIRCLPPAGSWRSAGRGRSPSFKTATACAVPTTPGAGFGRGGGTDRHHQRQSERSAHSPHRGRSRGCISCRAVGDRRWPAPSSRIHRRRSDRRRAQHPPPRDCASGGGRGMNRPESPSSRGRKTNLACWSRLHWP